MGSFQLAFKLILLWNIALIHCNTNSASDHSLIRKSATRFPYKSGRNYDEESTGTILFTLSIHSRKVELVQKNDPSVKIDVQGIIHKDPPRIEIIPLSFPSPLKKGALQTAYRNVSSYLVFQPKEDFPKTYAGKVAFVRDIDGKKSVEWSFIDNTIKDGSFASAFTKVHESAESKGRRFNTLTYAYKLLQAFKSYKKRVRRYSDNFKPDASLPPADQGRPDPAPLKPNVPDSSEEAINNHLLVELEVGAYRHQVDLNIDDTSFYQLGDAEINEQIRNEVHDNNRKKRSPEETLKEIQIGGRSRRFSPANKYKDIFYQGIGSCEREKFKLGIHNFWNAASRLFFYLNILRVQCLPKFQEQAEGLLKNKLVTEGAGFRYEFNFSHRYVKAETLEPDEWNDLISAIFLYTFSNAYANELEIRELSASDNRSPIDESISPTAKTMTTFVIKVVQFIGHHAFYHTIKIANVMMESLILMLQATVEPAEITDVAQDEVKVLFQDELQFAGLIGFLETELINTLSVGEDEIMEMFTEYFKTNVKFIKQSVKSYLANIDNDL